MSLSILNTAITFIYLVCKKYKKINFLINIEIVYNKLNYK